MSSMDAKEDDLQTALSDALLLRRFHEGDEDSFEALFQRHYDMVYGVLFRLTGTRDEAEDLLQEVFLRLYQRPLRHSDNVTGWLYRVAVNAGYNALRADHRRTRREQRAAAGESTTVSGPEDEVSRQEARQRVQRALARISPRGAKLLVLRETGFSYREMAQIVGVAPGSVGTLLARAQESFAKAFEGEEGKERNETP